MKVKLWGARGSIATPLTNKELKLKLKTALELGIKAGLNAAWQVPEFLNQLPWHVSQTAGGDTTCVEVNAGEKILILDAGTGIRPLGLDLMRRFNKKPIEAHILISHTHWDHICGIPFFVPAFIPGNNVRFYGANLNLEDRISNQQDFEYFPVPLEIMSAIKEFIQLETTTQFNIGDVKIQTTPLNHPGGCTGFRITHDGKTVVFATDSEYKDLSAEASKPFVEFFKDADLLIFDAQYSLLENVEKEDWGHSNAITGIDMAVTAGVKNLVLTHHEPTYSDEKLWEIFQNAEQYHKLQSETGHLKLYLAQEGLSISL